MPEHDKSLCEQFEEAKRCLIKDLEEAREARCEKQKAEQELACALRKVREDEEKLECIRRELCHYAHCGCGCDEGPRFI